MIRTTVIFSAFLGLAGCGDGNPFFPAVVVDPGTDLGGVELPPGTVTPTTISRYEERNAKGGGYAEKVIYNSVTDTFQVDNLAFDGLNTYQRSGVGAVTNLGGYALYEANITVPDFLTGTPVGQIVPYRAIYGESTNLVGGAPRSRFAIVRTGGYVEYGFGGFLYERNGTVVLPSDTFSGQAGFTGRYAGVRVFNGTSGMELTEGNMEVSIDFEDFNTNDAVSGRLYNRVAYRPDGTPVLVGNDSVAGQLPLPNLTFVIEEGVSNFNRNGEIAGRVSSTRPAINGNPPELYETGVYYGIISGDLTSAADGGEIVGVMVFESVDPRVSVGVPVQETGGFIVYR